jgi:hypothetical protein
MALVPDHLMSTWRELVLYLTQLPITKILSTISNMHVTFSYYVHM